MRRAVQVPGLKARRPNHASVAHTELVYRRAAADSSGAGGIGHARPTAGWARKQHTSRKPPGGSGLAYRRLNAASPPRDQLRERRIGL